MEPQQSNYWRFKKYLTNRSLNNAARANGAKGRQIPLNTFSFFGSDCVTVSSNRSSSGVTVYRSGRSETGGFPTAILGQVPVQYKYPF